MRRYIITEIMYIVYLTIIIFGVLRGSLFYRKKERKIATVENNLHLACVFVCMYAQNTFECYIQQNMHAFPIENQYIVKR